MKSSTQAVPAEDMMQAFIYHHLVPMNDGLAMVLERVRPRAPMKFLGEVPVKIPAGGTVQMKFSIITGPMLDQVQFALNSRLMELPPKICPPLRKV